MTVFMATQNSNGTKLVYLFGAECLHAQERGSSRPEMTKTKQHFRGWGGGGNRRGGSRKTTENGKLTNPLDFPT